MDLSGWNKWKIMCRETLGQTRVCVARAPNQRMNNAAYMPIDVHLQTIMWLSIDVSANINCPMKFHWELSCDISCE